MIYKRWYSLYLTLDFILEYEDIAFSCIVSTGEECVYILEEPF